MRRVVLPVLLLACVVVAGTSPGAAFAHTAVLEKSAHSDAPWVPPTGYGPAFLFPGAQDIPDPLVSRAVYGTLVGGESFDAYRFVTSADATVSIPVELLVPDTAANARFRPTFAVIGAGDMTGASSLPVRVREHLKAIEASVPVTVAADPGTNPRDTEYEPFVGETLFKGAAARADIGGRRTYYVIVYDASGGTGEYRLALGEIESFTFIDVVRTPLDILRVKLGLYGQDGFKWGFAAIVTGVIMALAGAAAFFARRRRRRGARVRRASHRGV